MEENVHTIMPNYRNAETREEIEMDQKEKNEVEEKKTETKLELTDAGLDQVSGGEEWNPPGKDTNYYFK